MEPETTFFNVWFDGLTDAKLWEDYGMCVNHGFSKEVCIPKVNMSKEELK